MSLTNREKELVKSSKLSLEEIINERNRFWTKEYPKYGFRKKVKYWLPSIHHSMRMAENTKGELSFVSPVKENINAGDEVA